MSRYARGLDIVASGPITTAAHGWWVPSSKGSRDYLVQYDPGNDSLHCDCLDSEYRRIPCKHIYAVLQVMDVEDVMPFQRGREDLIDFPTAPDWRDWYASRGMTPPSPSASESQEHGLDESRWNDVERQLAEIRRMLARLPKVPDYNDFFGAESEARAVHGMLNIALYGDSRAHAFPGDKQSQAPVTQQTPAAEIVKRGADL